VWTGGVLGKLEAGLAGILRQRKRNIQAVGWRPERSWQGLAGHGPISAKIRIDFKTVLLYPESR
jgi:hypothetical protein